MTEKFIKKDDVIELLRDNADVAKETASLQVNNIRLIQDMQTYEFDDNPTDFCEWIKYDYRTMCPKNHGDIDNPYWRIPVDMSHLKYCPYCSKEIKLIDC